MAETEKRKKTANMIFSFMSVLFLVLGILSFISGTMNYLFTVSQDINTIETSDLLKIAYINGSLFLVGIGFMLFSLILELDLEKQRKKEER